MIATPTTGHTGGDLHRVTGWGDMDGAEMVLNETRVGTAAGGPHRGGVRRVPPSGRTFWYAAC